MVNADASRRCFSRVIRFKHQKEDRHAEEQDSDRGSRQRTCTTIGVSKAYSGFNFTLAYTDTDAEKYNLYYVTDLEGDQKKLAEGALNPPL